MKRLLALLVSVFALASVRAAAPASPHQVDLTILTTNSWAWQKLLSVANDAEFVAFLQQYLTNLTLTITGTNVTATNAIQLLNGRGTNTTLINPSISTTNLIYASGAGLTNISASAIVYGPSISSFGNNQNVVEIGSTVNSTVLTWVLSGTTPTSQSVNQGIGTIAVGTLTATDSSAYTSARTYTLTVANANGSATANSAVSFESKNYGGASANSSLTDGQIIALSSGFNTGRQMTQSITASAQYIYVAYPAAYGAASFTVNGLPNTAWNLVTRAFVNASGYSASYNIYQSQNLLTGTYTIGVQ